MLRTLQDLLFRAGRAEAKRFRSDRWSAGGRRECRTWGSTSGGRGRRPARDPGEPLDFRKLTFGPGDKPSIGKWISGIIQEHGIERAVQEYRKARAERADAYSFCPEELNLLGRRLLAKRRYVESAAILELNAEIFPELAGAAVAVGDVIDQVNTAAMEMLYHVGMESEVPWSRTHAGLTTPSRARCGCPSARGGHRGSPRADPSHEVGAPTSQAGPDSPGSRISRPRK